MNHRIATFCLTVALFSVAGNILAAEPELPAWAAGTIPKAEAYEKSKADAEYLAKVKPNIPHAAFVRPAKPRQLLVFHNPRNYRHTAEVLSRKAVPEMGEKTGAFTATVTDDVSVFTPARLKEFDALFFNNVNSAGGGIGGPDDAGCQAVLDYVATGGGWAGNHASIVALVRNKGFAAMVGGTFADHPFGGKTVVVRNEAPGSPFTAAFGDASFPYLDEIFNIKGPFARDKQRVLLSIDWAQSAEAQAIDQKLREQKKTGSLRDDHDYPVSWIKPHGQGRVFYTSLGHEHATIADPRYLKHLLAGIQYALGDLPAPETNP
jgi:uncharacterized protein